MLVASFFQSYSQVPLDAEAVKQITKIIQKNLLYPNQLRQKTESGVTVLKITSTNNIYQFTNLYNSSPYLNLEEQKHLLFDKFQAAAGSALPVDFEVVVPIYFNFEDNNGVRFLPQAVEDEVREKIQAFAEEGYQVLRPITVVTWASRY